MKTVPIETETKDAAGRVTERATVPAHLMPPHPNACQICGMRPAHPPGAPHNAKALYYGYAFYGEHGRWPTWKDAIAHCEPEVRARWESELRRLNEWTEPPTEPAS